MGNEVIQDVRRDENDSDRIEIKRLVRRPSSGDNFEAGELAEIFEIVKALAPSLAIPDEEVNERVERLMKEMQPPSIFMVIKINRVVRGFVVAEVGNTANTSHVGWLRLEVHPDYQNRGLGKMLLTAIEGQALIEGLKRLEITSYRPNVKARSLFYWAGYRNEGFHRFARRDPASGKLIDTYTLAKYL